jgi:proline racemase
MLALAASYSVIDSHTAGHPTRVILSGLPDLPGYTVAGKRDFFRIHHDTLRPALLHEPSGHAAMVGLVPVASATAEFGAFFISSYIYLDMCGHAVIGYAKTLAATGSIAAPRANFTLEAPAGVVTAHLTWSPDGALTAVRLHNVASYAGVQSLTVDVDGIGAIRVDLAYGGIWYAIVDAGAIGLPLEPEYVSRAMAWGAAIKTAVTAALVSFPPGSGGGTAPSVLFYEEKARLRARHLVVLASNKFDRSPCGTGCSARIALLAHQGRMAQGETYMAENLFGVAFAGRIAGWATERGIIPEIEGAAHISAFSTIVKEVGDKLGGGFLCI